MSVFYKEKCVYSAFIEGVLSVSALQQLDVNQ